MNQRSFYLSIICVFIMSLLLTGCGITPPAVIPTATPTIVLPPMKDYTHFSSIFTISVPADWTKIEEEQGYAYFQSPDKYASLVVSAENTGTAFNAATFLKAVNAFEFNNFSSHADYRETGRDVQADKGYAAIDSTLKIKDVPFHISNRYTQKGKILYIESFLSILDLWNKYGPLFHALKDRLVTNLPAAESLEPYMTYPFYYDDPDDLYSLLIPSLWTHKDNNKDGSLISFTSPDGNAQILLAKKELGVPVTQENAQIQLVELFKSINSDLKPYEMEVDKNMNVHLIWEIKTDGRQGVTIVNAQWSGTTWYALTWITNAGFEKMYEKVILRSIDSSIDSYRMPE